ncbi:hypothetical protein BH10PSE17_BH10PSE17_13740 [soil metagenome]
MTFAHRSRQAGRTLIELLVSMTIGLIITAFVAGIYMSASQTSRVANQLSTMEDSGRTVMTLIGNSIKQAGYAEIIGVTPMGGGFNTNALYRSQTLFGDDRHLVGCTGATALKNAQFNAPAAIATASTVVTCTDFAGSLGNPTGTGNDALMVRYQGDTALAASQTNQNDCLNGGAWVNTADPNYKVSRPIIENIYFIDNGTLRCIPAGAAGTFDQARGLISNVEQFKIFYGYDDVRAAAVAANSNNFSQPSARSLRDSTFLNGVTAVNAWDFVVSVQVCMVIRSDANDPGVATAGGGYQRCPITAAEAVAGTLPDTQNDGFLRRTYLQVFNVRARSSYDPLSTL